VAVFFLLGTLMSGLGAQSGRVALRGHVPAAVAGLTAKGRLPATNQLALAIGLPLRNEAELDELLRQLYDPASTNFHKFLTPVEFTARFGPTEVDYAAVRQFAESNGLAITGTHSNRAVLDVSGSVAVVETAFQITLNRYGHPFEPRDFFAPDSEPVMDAALPIKHVSGLDNFLIPQPLLAKAVPLSAHFSNATPMSGSGISGLYAGNDFRAAYVPGSALNGAGQTVALFELEGYYGSDITNYENQFNLPLVTLTNVPVDSFSGVNTTDTNGIVEVSLDIEMAIAMATNLSRVIVYEAANNGATSLDMLNRIASDNLAQQISSSWAIGNNASFDTAYKQMAAQGQSFFQASGDNGAYYSGITQWADDTNITLVGGTTLSTTGAGGAWASEMVWNWYSTGQGTMGSGGGVNIHSVAIPSWQTGISMTANQGSTTLRNVPDVALTADNIQVVACNGVNYSVGGTSAAAPLWAGFNALINQQAALAAKPPVGFLNPALYAIGKGMNYTACFHDITTGNNTNATVGNKYYAVTGYDLCTGWGTPNGTNLINALAPLVFAAAITNAGWTLLAESATPTNGAIDPGETVTVNFTLQNQGNLATTNLVATLLASTNLLAPSGAQTFGALAAAGGAANKSFAFTAAGTCGSSIVATLQLQDGTNNLGTVSFTLPLGSVSTNRVQTFAQNFDGVAAPALPAGWTTTNITGTVNNWATTTAVSDTSPNSVFVADVASTSENALVSPVISITVTNAQLSFRHKYSFDYHSGSSHAYRDGGVLEIKIGPNGFTDIVSAGGSFVAGGYNNVINTSNNNPLNGRSAWVGIYNFWQTVTVTLPASAVGQNIQLRWNCATDSSNTGIGTGAVGWYVDSVVITNIILTPNCSPVFTDLAVSQSLATNSLTAGQNLVYTLTITNLGPQAAANVMLTDAVPANATFVSATDGYSYSTGQVVWPVGMLALATTTNFTITLTPATGNFFTNFVSVGTVTPEITLTNNGATLIATQNVSTSVSQPSITSVTTSPGGGLQLQLVGAIGQTYILEATTNLFPANWEPVATNTLDNSGQWQFNNPQPTNTPNCFYRLKLVQQ